jgi:predicted metal-dependent TIM-barrel fold hydrolase
MEMSTDRAKKYVLFVFGQFKTEDDIVQELITECATIIESNYMKFIFNPNSFIAHFTSKLPFEDLKEHFDNVLSLQVEQYFLSEMTNEFAVGMNPDLMEGLFNLDEDNKEISHVSMKMILEDLNSVGENGLMDFLQNLPKIIEKAMTEDLENIKPSIIKKVVSLDEVLDKITEEGIESLTEEEKQILENYARDRKSVV